MTRETINSQSAPKAIGPYSHAVAAGNLLFLSGQTPLDPQSGALIEGDIKAQTERALENIAGVIETTGLTMRDVVKANVYLTSMSDFAAMNEVYSRFFPGDPPARSTVAVSELPRGAKVEVEVIAVRSDQGNASPSPIAPYAMRLAYSFIV